SDSFQQSTPRLPLSTIRGVSRRRPLSSEQTTTSRTRACRPSRIAISHPLAPSPGSPRKPRSRPDAPFPHRRALRTVPPRSPKVFHRRRSQELRQYPRVATALWSGSSLRRQRAGPPRQRARGRGKQRRPKTEPDASNRVSAYFADVVSRTSNSPLSARLADLVPFSHRNSSLLGKWCLLWSSGHSEYDTQFPIHYSIAFLQRAPIKQSLKSTEQGRRFIPRKLLKTLDFRTGFAHTALHCAPSLLRSQTAAERKTAP